MDVFKEDADKPMITDIATGVEADALRPAYIICASKTSFETSDFI